MAPIGVYNRLSNELRESESRTGERLDRLEGMLATLMKAAGLPVPPKVPDRVDLPAAAFPAIGEALDRSAPPVSAVEQHPPAKPTRKRA